MDMRSLESSVNTMKFIKKNTKLRIPEIISWDNTLENELNAPYIMMQHVEGRQLTDLWFSGQCPHVQEQRRQKIMKAVAQSIAELRFLEFEASGALQFEPNDENFERPSIVPAMYQHFGEPTRDGEWYEHWLQRKKTVITSPVDDLRLTWTRGSRGLRKDCSEALHRLMCRTLRRHSATQDLLVASSGSPTTTATCMRMLRERACMLCSVCSWTTCPSQT